MKLLQLLTVFSTGLLAGFLLTYWWPKPELAVFINRDGVVKLSRDGSYFHAKAVGTNSAWASTNR